MAERENVAAAAGPSGAGEVAEDEEEQGEDADLHEEEPSSSRKDGGDDDDNHDEDGPSLLSRRTTSKAVKSQGATRRTEGGDESSQPQGEQPTPENQSGTHQSLNLSTSSDSDHLPSLPFFSLNLQPLPQSYKPRNLRRWISHLLRSYLLKNPLSPESIKNLVAMFLPPFTPRR